MKYALSLVIALILASGHAIALTLTSDAPCNVFVAGDPIAFRVRDAQGDATYEMVDYYGKKIAQGSVPPNGAIRVAASRLCWYELNVTDAKGSTTASLVVVADRKGAALPKQGRIGAVACSAWLIKNEDHRKPFAKMLGLVGMPWVREPLHWEETQPKDGPIDWGKYQTVHDLSSAEGVYTNMGWTSVPLWTHPGNGGMPYPDDYRTLYRYLKTAARHFASNALVWDVLNEVELSWPLLSDTCAPMQKVSYLAIKAGNPKARVLSASLTHVSSQGVCDWGTAGFAQGLYECGIGDYFDIFNHHTYLPTWTYQTSLSAHRTLMRKYGITGKAAWLTEAGLGMCGTDGPGEHLMSKTTERQQCRLVPMSATMGLVAGNEKYYWFVLPDYIENGSAQFGMLHPDLQPYPSLAAMSACCNLIGVSEYVGEYNADGHKSVAHLFSTPKGNVLVAWSDKAMELAIPTENASVVVADMFGAESVVPVKAGRAVVRISPEATYIRGFGNKLLAQVTRVAHEPIAPESKPSTVVLAGRGDLPIDRNYNAYKLSAGGIAVAGTPFTYTVDVYQFDEKTTATGFVEMVAPEGWMVDKPRRSLKIAPMGRETVTFRVTPVPSFLGIQKIVVKGSFGGKRTAPAAAFVKYDFNVWAF